jgi:hypothetical protein
VKKKGTCLVGYGNTQKGFAYLLSSEGSGREQFQLDFDDYNLNKTDLIIIDINWVLKDQPKFRNLFSSNHKPDHHFPTAFFNQPYQDPISIPNKLSEHTKEERIKLSREPKSPI